MLNSELESWALREIDAVVKGQPTEDDRVEMKTTWIGAHDAARRIAGHANASRGEPALWLIGVNEKEQDVPGVPASEFTEWWGGVEKSFQSVAPEPRTLHIRHTDDATVVAILFDTSRSPFVVKNPAFGVEKTSIASEVPWRGGTAVRTATREDLLRMLVPSIAVPKIEDSWLKATGSEGDSEKSLSLSGAVYLANHFQHPIHIPFHRIHGWFTSASGGVMPISDVGIEAAESKNRNFLRSDADLTATGPGMLALSVHAALKFDHSDQFDSFGMNLPLSLHLEFPVLGAERPMLFDVVLRPEGVGCWSNGKTFSNDLTRALENYQEGGFTF